jgi:oxygen-independent coproporphyrinogen-3 oxidase
LKYWLLEPYIGFGADAHSFDGATRYQNVESAAEYAERECPRLSSEAADPAEKFFVGLRLSSGVQPCSEDSRKWAAPISRFIGEGLLETHAGRLRLTDRGVLLSNEVFAEFIA